MIPKICSGDYVVLFPYGTYTQNSIRMDRVCKMKDNNVIWREDQKLKRRWIQISWYVIVQCGPPHLSFHRAVRMDV